MRLPFNSQSIPSASALILQASVVQERATGASLLLLIVYFVEDASVLEKLAVETRATHIEHLLHVG